MKIDFTETEQPERDFFEAALAEHDLRFLTGLGEVEADADILCIYIASRIDAAFLDAHPELNPITTRSAGHDHIDVSECSRRGVIVCEVPGSNANTVAEHTFALVLALSRRIIEARKAKKERGAVTDTSALLRPWTGNYRWSRTRCARRRKHYAKGRWQNRH
jgi:D-lactate dehydrogenase